MLKRFVFFTILLLIINNCAFSQSLIDFSKYKISMLSKNQKQNCSSWRITIPIDLNKDGLIDFVTTGDDMGPCSTNGEITYLNFFENDGLDNFIEKTTKYAKDSLWSIRPTWYLVEDFNGDGKKDIFITGEQIHGQWNNNYLKAYPFLKPGVDIDTSNNFSFVQRRHHIYLSQSDGTFKDSPDFLQGMRLGSTFGITAIDYNKDGYMDLVNAVQQFSNNDKVLPSGWDVEIYLNNSGKSMTRKTPFTVRGAIDANNNIFNKSRIDSIGGNSEGPENIKLYDVNNDGYLDMIFNDRDGNALCMLSQKKELDLYSPVIKFDDYQTNGLLINMPGSKIGIRGFYLVDIKNNGTQQLIEYWANGDGDYQPGKKLYQLIKVFEIKDGSFVDATSTYFNLNENINKTYGFSTLNLIDIDNDGFIDLFPNGFNQDGKGFQGFNGSDSTMYYKNVNGKFSLKSMGLKYYFKEFKELADSMKVFDPLHKFSIANNLIPINTGKSNKLIFYSYGTEPGIERSSQNFPNDNLLNKEKQVYNDSLSTYFKGFILALDKGPDTDNDGISDIDDNCKNIYNPIQEDLDNNKVGDACEWSPILLQKYISILQDVDSTYTIPISNFLLDNTLPYVSFGDGEYKNYMTIANNKINIKSNFKSNTKDFFRIPVTYNKNSTTIIDSITIYIIRYLNWTKNTGKLQNGYIPYYYESYSNGENGLSNVKFGPNQYFTPANQSNFVIQDIDKNGINDIIAQSVQLAYPPISDTSKRGDKFNIQRIGIPIYIKFDSNFNATYYHENFRNPDVLWHQPDFFAQVDLNNDGKKEIINLGEHYHTDYFLGEQDTALSKNKLGKDVLKYLGMIENRDYNQQTAGKLSRYYTIENGRLKDQKDKYDYSALNSGPTDFPRISNSKFVSIFGSAFGDIDNDGDIDYIQSVQVDGWNVDILINDGKGNFKYKRVNTEQYNYKTNPEGENILVDINGDGYLDYFFGGTKLTNNNQDENGLGYILNDKKGGFKIDSVNFVGNFGSTIVSPKYMFTDDLDKDGKKEIIIYRSTGLGSGGNGTANQDFIDDILILTIDKGKIINNTNNFIDTLSRSKMYAQSSFLYYQDLDGDKIKDLFVRYEVDSAIIKSYSPFYGYWEKNYNGFSYFKGSKEGKFKYTRLGKFVLQDGFKNWYSPSEFSGILSNDFQPADLDNDGTAELIHQPTGGSNMIIFKLHNCNPPKPIFTSTRISFPIGDSLKLTVSNIYKGDTLKWYYGSKTDFTNVSSKTFTDSTKLFVTRTDSLGCVISSDTIKISTYLKQQITTKFRTFKFNLSSYKDAAPNIGQKMHQAICQTVLYYVNGIEHIVTIPVDSVANAPIHFINKNGNWELQSFYPNFKMDGARNYSFIDTLGNFAYSNHGSEVPKPWPLGDVVLVNTINDTLKWTKANTVKAFYHSVGTGDLNGDGLTDLVGLHMQSNYWADNLHPFLQNANGTFSEGRNVISAEVGARRNSSGAVLVTDLLGDAKPEIVRGSYGFTGANGEARYAFEILGFDKQSNQYIKVYEPKNLGVFTDIVNGGQGATSIKSADFDHNGFQDLIICSEGSLPNSSTKGASMIQIWLNNGKGEFIPDQYIINNADDSLNIREFEVADIDKDGWPDIVMHGIGGALYRGLVPNSKYGTYFKINNLIWKNNRGVFDILPNQLNVYDSTNIELIGNSNFLKGFMVNGKLKFVGFENVDANNQTKLYEITVNFCNNLIKPTFSNSKYSFCVGDSLKLTVSNINKGDTLKWYYGTKSDLTNVSSKIFTDSTKLFVTRTDSAGCVISSDTIQIKKYGIPSAPSISRDTSNYLSSGVANTTWYKDGTTIADTTQKYKPTDPGSYSAKTTKDGCTSAMSVAYYYLVTDIVNLSKDEFIKLAPNPFINQLNFDFVVKGYQKLNIEVFDLATGAKVASKQNLTPGNSIYLGQLAAGTYVIKVSSNDNKIVHQFKMVKL